MPSSARFVAPGTPSISRAAGPRRRRPRRATREPVAHRPDHRRRPARRGRSSRARPRSCPRPCPRAAAATPRRRGTPTPRPGCGRCPVSQPFGSRPSMRIVTSVPAGDVTRTSLAPRSRAATPLGDRADLLEVGRHRAVRPRVDAVRRVEAAARAAAPGPGPSPRCGRASATRRTGMTVDAAIAAATDGGRLLAARLPRGRSMATGGVAARLRAPPPRARAGWPGRCRRRRRAGTGRSAVTPRYRCTTFRATWSSGVSCVVHGAISYQIHDLLSTTPPPPAPCARGRPATGSSFRLHRPRGAALRRGLVRLVRRRLHVGRGAPARPAAARSAASSSGQPPWFWERRFRHPRAARRLYLEVLRRASSATGLPPAPPPPAPRPVAGRGARHRDRRRRPPRPTAASSTGARGRRRSASTAIARSASSARTGRSRSASSASCSQTGSWERLPPVRGNDLPGLVGPAMAAHLPAGARVAVWGRGPAPDTWRWCGAATGRPSASPAAAASRASSPTAGRSRATPS